MDATNGVKLAAAALMLGLAGVLFWRFVRGQHDGGEKAFFYDLSEQKLFVADRGLIPPIRGINDEVEDGVRAVVVSTNGQPQVKSTWRIAYLETYTPELKQQMDTARATGTSPQMGRTAAQAHRLVRRPADREWVSMASPEGEALVNEWTTWGDATSAPIVCSP